ncbi:MAG: cytochrome c3 family protein, partial [Aureliella sp.]
VEIEHLGVKSRMYREGDKYMISTEGPDGTIQDFEIKYVFGVEPLQQYMVEFGSGEQSKENELPRVQVLRVSWDTEKKQWFHLDPPDVDERLAPDDDLHWTGVTQRWNNMCAECHSTNFQKNFDVKALNYHSTFTDIDVSCEACHGPGSKHIEEARQWLPGWSRQRGYGLANLKRSAEDQIQACAPCHSRRSVIAAGFRAGDNFYDYYADQLLTAGIYYPDGQVLDEDYIHGSFIQSKMYHKGIRCTDCHDPHTARLKADGNQVCTSCHQHPQAKYDSVAHHFHKPGTPGAQCVNCHMPATTYMAVDERHDHSIRIPRPDLSLKIDTPNACTGCHVNAKNVAEEKRPKLPLYQDWMQAARDGDEEVKKELERANRWCDEACDKWYGEMRRRDEHFGEAIAAGQKHAPDAVERLTKLLQKPRVEVPAIARATALQTLAQIDAAAAGELAAKAIRDDHPLVRAGACDALPGNVSRSQSANLLADTLTDPVRLVRTAAARNLLQYSQAELPASCAPRLRQAVDELVEGAMVDSDRSGAHLNLAIIAEQEGRQQAAIEHYRNAMRVEPNVTGPRTNLAALLERNLTSQAAQAGGAVDPDSPIAKEISELREAELKLLARDVKLLPEAAALQYRYGLALYADGQKEAAMEHLLKAAELEPNSYDYVQGVTLLYKSLERWDEAAEWAEKLIQLAPGDPVPQQILSEIERRMP